MLGFDGYGCAFVCRRVGAFVTFADIIVTIFCIKGTSFHFDFIKKPPFTKFFQSGLENLGNMKYNVSSYGYHIISSPKNEI